MGLIIPSVVPVHKTNVVQKERRNICEKKTYGMYHLRDHLVVIMILWFPWPFRSFSLGLDTGGLEHCRC